MTEGGVSCSADSNSPLARKQPSNLNVEIPPYVKLDARQLIVSRI